MWAPWGSVAHGDWWRSDRAGGLRSALELLNFVGVPLLVPVVGMGGGVGKVLLLPGLCSSFRDRGWEASGELGRACERKGGWDPNPHSIPKSLGPPLRRALGILERAGARCPPACVPHRGPSLWPLSGLGKFTLHFPTGPPALEMRGWCPPHRDIV